MNYQFLFHHLHLWRHYLNHKKDSIQWSITAAAYISLYPQSISGTDLEMKFYSAPPPPPPPPPPLVFSRDAM